MPRYTETDFEEHIEAHLNQSDYRSLQSSHYNKSLCLISSETLRFIQMTQLEAYQKLERQYGEETPDKLLRCLVHFAVGNEKVSMTTHLQRYDKNHDVKDVQALTDSLIKTVEALQKLAAIEQQVPPNDSRTQLVAVLERLTLALDTPEPFALGSDTETFVEVLERLTLALKASDHKAITGKTESMPTDNGQDTPAQPVHATRKPEDR